MKLLLPSTVAQSRDLALLASSWAEVFPTASTTPLFSSSRDVQAGRLSNHRGLCVWTLRNLFFFLCLVTCALSQLLKSWFMIHGRKEADSESFGRGQAVGGV